MKHGYVPDEQMNRGYVPSEQMNRGYVPDEQANRGYVPGDIFANRQRNVDMFPRTGSGQ